jgi:serine/threonine-protein kinase
MEDWASFGREGPKPGDVVAGKYELVRVIGRGGMGSVFEARHVALGRPLAIKFLRPDVADERDVIERFFREARVASALAHPRIVDVFDVGWTDDGLLPWFAMELLEGRSLAEEMSTTRQLPAVRATSIASQVLDALEAAHARGIIHRDLKPENVFLIRHGIEDEVKVLDFGISKVMAKRITVTGVVLGTPAYMSPEQARGARDIDHRADIYSAGAILFEMLAGRAPYEGANYHAILLAIMTEERPTLQSLRPTLHPDRKSVV